jgi:hypothetical protein
MKLLKSFMAASLLVLPMMVLNVQAQTGETWNPGPSAGNWNVAANWGGAGGVVPITGYKAFLNAAGAGACIVSDTEGGCQISIGNGGPGVLIVTNGGVLSAGDDQNGANTSTTATGWTEIGANNVGEMIINGGTVTFNWHCYVGQATGGNGTLIIDSGLVTDTNFLSGGPGPASFFVGTGGGGATGGTGLVELNGGTLMAANDHLNFPTNGSGTINLAGGILQLLYLNGDSSQSWTPFITSSNIIAYGGAGTVTVALTNSTFATLYGVPPSGSGPTSGPSQITSIYVRPGGQVSLTFNSATNATYHIVSSPTLSVNSTTWTTTVAGSSNVAMSTSTTVNFTDPATKDFYRVVSP